jgi:hypothetical protein
MRIQLRNTYVLAVIATVLFAAPGFARSHHELNGTWKLIPTRSNFEGEPVIETGTVTINDREHNITVSRSFTYDGASQTNSYNFTTDGRENSTIHDGKTFKSKAKWDGDALIVRTTQDDQTATEHFNLERDGTLRLVIERPAHSPVTLYFERQ